MNVTQQTDFPAEPLDARLCALTAKQREVLDLLIQFKTSKEISRLLAISPHTVDQRVDAAKGKLGASSRAELAVIYRNLVDDGAPLYDRLTYETSPLGTSPIPPHGSTKAEAEALDPIVPFDRAAVEARSPVERDYRVVPEVFDGRWGTAARLMAILAITILLCISFLGGFSILMEMSNFMGG